jgi:hypothetical protein
MNDQMNPYLLKGLPMVDVLVLDEADRMIADGHFREMKDILAHIYTQRVRIKTKKPTDMDEKEPLNLVEATTTEDFVVSKSLEGNDDKIDWSKVKDLYDDEEIVNDIQNEGEMVFEEEEIKEKNEKKNKQKHLNKKQI